jgi:hypothetical protein
MESLGQMSSPGEQTGEARQAELAAFGLSLRFDVAPPGAWVAQASHEPGTQGEAGLAGAAGEPDLPGMPGGPGLPDTPGEAGHASLPSLEIRSSISAQAIEDSWSGLQEIGWEGVIDGAPFVVERGIAGDHRFVHGAHPDRHGAPQNDAPPDDTPADGKPSDEIRAVHHLSPDASVLQCAPVDPTDPSWWRVVLDSVLFTVALLQGYEALHAGAVATPDGVIAITAASGGGKSTLLSELVGRGMALMADDVLVLAPRDTLLETRDTVLAPRGTDFSLSLSPLTYPAPPLMTVPNTRIAILGDSNYSDTPEIISSLEDEYWIAVPVYPEPLPLKTLVVLDRQPGLQLSLEKIEDPLAPLMGSLMNFPRTPERQRTRFELASTLASNTRLWRLAADVDTPPDVLADMLLAG